ncbi:MAG: response regulator [Rhodospirillales bacterium]|nr:response regulator [Rhodospirillales bacterium]MCB9995017.1 response regulator [Rhodospirillales bacterium]
MKILLVDDDEFVRTLLLDQLTDEGYDVVAENNVDDALVLLSRDSYDLLITDIVMPHKDGGQLMQQARQGGYAGPIIAITGGFSNAQEDYANYADLFADKTFVKPIAKDDLIAAIRELT